MAQLTKAAEDRIIRLLIMEGLADANSIAAVQQAQSASSKPILPELINKKVVNEDKVVNENNAIKGQ